jgi:hypothetical protein
MADQPSYKPLEPSQFFADGLSARPLPPGTVARGHLRADVELFGGRRGGAARATMAVGTGAQGPLGVTALAAAEETDEVDAFPFPVTRAVLENGRNRYMIYCVVCHDPVGTGRGKIVERGYTPPPSFHVARLRAAPVGHFFRVITEGYGSMPDYAAQVPPRDRWAIVTYIRALQLSRHFPEKDLSPEMRAEWERQDRTSPAGGAAE